MTESTVREGTKTDKVIFSFVKSFIDCEGDNGTPVAIDEEQLLKSVSLVSVGEPSVLRVVFVWCAVLNEVCLIGVLIVVASGENLLVVLGDGE